MASPETDDLAMETTPGEQKPEDKAEEEPKKVAKVRKCPPGPPPLTGFKWYMAGFIWYLSGCTWVFSIPLFALAVGFVVESHIGLFFGWFTGQIVYGILTNMKPINQWLAVTGVMVSASLCAAENKERAFWSALILSAATFFGNVCTMPHVPWLFDMQCRYYGGYHRKSELRGALDSVEKGRTMFVSHPHGILCIGYLTNVCFGQAFHEIAGRCHFLIDRNLRKAGLCAKMFLDGFEGPHGGFRDNTRETFKDLIARGESLSVIPGGFQEATLFVSGRQRVVILERKGWLKYCLRGGYRVHPVFTFGETDTFRVNNVLEDFRLSMNQNDVPACIFLPWLHKCSDMITYIGEPILLPLIEEPTEKDVDDWHSKYVEALKELFEKYKADAGYPDAQIELM